ncbi:MAG: nuclear transport factor 2 family protein [Caulobacteraceae bacterium]|nr:MAG: nuclear transport factor 2 family protein [Caulobacteraceae bacterium]
MTDDDRRRAHIAVLKRYRDAWSAGDIAALFALYADDFVLHWNGNNPLAGAHVGKPAAIAALSSFTRKTDRRLVGVLNIMADADKAVMIARERLAGREVDRTLIYRTDGEKVVECWVLDADQAWIDGLLNA